jgi:sugar phosphate isomerase/epimerase
MRIATAPVNWNNADVTDYRPWTPYPALLDEMVSAGYRATEWGMNMEKDARRLREDLNTRNLQLLGGFVGLELRSPDRKSAEIERGIELATFFRDSGATEMLERYGNRIGYVHIKDLDKSILEQAKTHGWSFAQALKSYIFAPLGQGAARIPDVVEKLRLADYDGWVVIEQDTTPDDPTETARKNREFFEHLLAQLPPPTNFRTGAASERSPVETGNPRKGP